MRNDLPVPAVQENNNPQRRRVFSLHVTMNCIVYQSLVTLQAFRMNS